MSGNGRNIPSLNAFERLRGRARQCRLYYEHHLWGRVISENLAAMPLEEVTLTLAEITAADEILRSVIEKYNLANDSDTRFMSFEDYKLKYGNRANSVNEEIAETSRLVAMWCDFAMTQIAGLEEIIPPSNHHTYFGAVHMGDVFQGISNSTIVSRSTIEGAFNRLQSSGHIEGAALLVEIAKRVAEANNPAAGAVYAQMAHELSKPSHDKGLLKSFWDGLVAILPPLATLSTEVIKAFVLPT